MKLQEITLRRVRLPLIRPYRVSYITFEEFEPIIVEVRDSDGRTGWGEGHISPGSSAETRDGGWAFCRDYAARLVGRSADQAKAMLIDVVHESRVAASAIVSAIEMLEGNPLLAVDDAVSFPLLTPFNSFDHDAIPDEVEQHLAAGYRTFKIKIGLDVEADLARVAAIQSAVAGRATLRIDANRAYDEATGCRFAAALDPTGIELFEQPCPAEDWHANAAVAKVSTVPLMLDEPICEIGDIERAATIEGVGLCKLKLRRFGGLDRLERALRRVSDLGMEPVLGDGIGADIACWMEACVARTTIRNAGEFNGFLKPGISLFTNPPTFENGAMVLPRNYVPEVDRDVLARHEIASERYAAPQISVPSLSQ